MSTSAESRFVAPARVPSSLDPAIPTHPSEFPCIDLVNSSFTNHLGKGPAIDRLQLPDWQAWFLERHDLGLSHVAVAPVAELARLRGSLRRQLERWAQSGSVSASDVRELDRWVSAAPVRRRIERRSGLPAALLEPVRRDWTWVIAELAASAAALIAEGEPSRLKTCANPDCSWIFYDRSHNASRRFCSTSPCATVVRVRRFRESRRRA